MSKKIAAATLASSTEDQNLHNKAELATQAVDMLLFQGEIGAMVQGLARMIPGVSQVSIGMILPEKKPHNLRPFLVSLNSIISTALDEQVDFNHFVVRLHEEIQVIRQIVAEEKQ